MKSAKSFILCTVLFCAWFAGYPGFAESPSTGTAALSSPSATLSSETTTLASTSAAVQAVPASPSAAVSSVSATVSDAECMGCHSDKDLRRESGPGSGTLVFVPENALKGTPHESFACVDCHADAKEVPHPSQLATAACGVCHPQPLEDHSASIHGLAALKNNPDAPTCHDCHGKHQIKSATASDSAINARNVAATCAKCHENPETTKRNHFNVVFPLQNYQTSVHYSALQKGLKAANCSECHGSHLIRKSQDPRSKTNRANVPATCGQCHAAILKVYEKSIHGQALAHGVSDAPVCTDCHGEHGAGGKSDPNSNLNPLNISNAMCSQCHNNKKMMAKYGVDSTRSSTYEDSYHGLALKGGLARTANCSSCHGSHDILGMSDPNSKIYPANLGKTCRQCHTKADESFARIPVHSRTTVPLNLLNPEWWAEFIRWMYVILIVLTIGGMLLHNVVIMFRFVREKIRRRRETTLYVRFSTFEVVNHFVLILTFTTLVITGFALKFPDTFWVKTLVWLGMTETLRGILHRIAGSILILQGIIQCIWQIGTARGRRELWALIPWFNDLYELFHNIFYHLGIAKKAPHFGHYNYIEKSEYWAMAWGTIIMGITGLMLWFPVIVFAYLPPWILKIGEIIHYYEAWLATLAILVWHMFFTFLHPHEYPFSITWIDGKITEEELKHHRPREYEEMASTGKLAGADTDEKADTGSHSSHGH